MDNNNSEPTETPSESVSTTEWQIELAVVHGQTSGLITVTNNALRLSDDTTLEQWTEGLRLINWLRRRSGIAVSHYLTFGVKKWGRDTVDRVLDQLEFEARLAKTAVSINSIPEQLRFDNLNDDHYVELARSGLNGKGMVRWARIASEQGLTATQLRFSIAEGEVVDRAAAKMLGTGVITIHGIRQSFDVWARRVGGIGGVIDMDMDHKVEIMEELQAICEFGLQLNHHIMLAQNKAEVENANQPEPAGT